MKKVIFIWNTTRKIGTEKFQQVSVGEGDGECGEKIAHAAFTNLGYGGGAMAALDFWQVYDAGCLTGCVVFDNEKNTVRTIVPDNYRDDEPYHEINFSMDHVFESTVIRNPSRYNIGWVWGSVTNRWVEGKELRIETNTIGEIFLDGNSVEFEQFSPKVKFEIEKGRFPFGKKFAATTVNNFIELKVIE